MKFSQNRGFTLLELLLSLAIFTAMGFFLNRFLLRISDQSQRGLIVTQNSYCRSKIVRQIEMDIEGKNADHFTSMGANGFRWEISAADDSDGEKYCVYYFKSKAKKLYRFQLETAEIPEGNSLAECHLLATGIDFFSGELRFSERENRDYFLIKIAANREGTIYQTRFWLDAREKPF